MGNIQNFMSLQRLLKIFYRTGFIQFGLVVLFYLVLFLSKYRFSEDSQATIIMALFSFLISTVLNVIGIFSGSLCVGLMNKNIAYYSIVIFVPLVISTILLVISNKLESKYFIFLIPAFMAFIVSHFILYFSILKKKSK